VPPDHPRALATAVQEVCEHPAAAERRAVAARERLHRDFGLPEWLDRYLAVYRAVCRR
jgi:hypothetical protein